ncbi:putative ubiquitin-conjugating enzyme E2 38 [Diospyros lotus]|uniref:putative ubiquitin-conjugating enzyme E2 38 n=1 Tax=Diospyros lotus TaxID=55363 RepID=UPI00225573BA|nr:putative ubiquitin-conjugating enzyme E2 38 [Diospyros lotus]
MEDVHGLQENNLHGEIEEIEDETDKRFKRFKNFDIDRNLPLDHHFVNCGRSTKPVPPTSSLAETLREERRILGSNLPNSIFVRGYENRIDLMRAAIIGPPDTPYHLGIFFFDVLFPGDYPARPPKLSFHSQGLDLHPGLRPDGKVCLSLLENWYGRLVYGWFGCNAEKWNPKRSNLAQVLLSIRCLILNEQPYYNQPIRLYTSKWNKNKFMLSCEAMIRTLESPPRGFEDFVAGHFRRRAHPILTKYGDLMDESEGMRQLFLKLVKAFEENGAYCKHHLGQVKVKPKK